VAANIRSVRARVQPYSTLYINRSFLMQQVTFKYLKLQRRTEPGALGYDVVKHVAV